MQFVYGNNCETLSNMETVLLLNTIEKTDKQIEGNHECLPSLFFKYSLSKNTLQF